MGNANSNKNIMKFNNINESIDYIATYYILTLDFKSLSQLMKKEYCDKLVILTSDIIQNKFNRMEINYLEKRIKNGVEVSEIVKDNVEFFNKDNITNLEEIDEQKKQRVCIGIAKFYIKIAHLFAAILKTINPTYVYKNQIGETIQVPLLDRDTIPLNVNKEVFNLNLCDNRINALKQGNYDMSGENIILQPKVCSMNLDKNGNQMYLKDEPGIPELIQLYLDDKYDYSNGTFEGMSKSTEKEYKRDLAIFYSAFTGNSDMPSSITKFSDIKLRDYSLKPNCIGNNSILKQPYILSKNDKLLVEYANNLKKMMEQASKKQNELLSILNEVFTYTIDQSTNKKIIKINSKLTETKLQQLIEKTRRIILDLYVKCEMDYVNGIKIFEAIVESKILETTKRQIQTLEEQAKQIIEQTKNTIYQSPTPTEEKVKINIQPNILENKVEDISIPSSKYMTPINNSISTSYDKINSIQEPSEKNPSFDINSSSYSDLVSSEKKPSIDINSSSYSDLVSSKEANINNQINKI
jgi:hypothetical protein